VGVTTGLAWTEFGGELLYIEAVMLPGKGKMQITGKLARSCRNPSKQHQLCALPFFALRDYSAYL